MGNLLIIHRNWKTIKIILKNLLLNYKFLGRGSICKGKEVKAMLFISMSFNEIDYDINQYFINILDALQVEFETGEQ